MHGRPTAKVARNGLEGNRPHRTEELRRAPDQGIGISIEHSLKYLKAITTACAMVTLPSGKVGRRPVRLEISSTADSRIRPFMVRRAVSTRSRGDEKHGDTWLRGSRNEIELLD